MVKLQNSGGRSLAGPLEDAEWSWERSVLTEALPPGGTASPPPSPSVLRSPSTLMLKGMGGP